MYVNTHWISSGEYKPSLFPFLCKNITYINNTTIHNALKLLYILKSLHNAFLYATNSPQRVYQVEGFCGGNSQIKFLFQELMEIVVVLLEIQPCYLL